jgi:GH15 family glucan-1,4-alpha-glucosidase
MSYIDKSANVVWQCWPQFDSSFIFGGLISDKKGGEFSITPPIDYQSEQYYMDNTNVLVTEFSTKEGSYRVIDFAPRFELFERYHKPLMLFRKIEKISGTPRVTVSCRPMGDYGNLEGLASQGSNHISYSGLGQSVRLTTNISKSNIINETPFVLSEDKFLVLSWGSPLEAPLKRTVEDFLQRTKNYWRNWIEKSAIPNIYQKEVIRSALLLKMHQYEDTGAIIASGTTSLPEHPGEERNWDYRFCWIRDSYFTLAALNNLGHFTEAERYSHYIQNLIQNEEKTFQPVYSITGAKTLTERTVDLEGYKGNAPVRVGNEAYLQIQHDVYGQMLLTIMPLYTDLRIQDSSSRPSLDIIHKILDRIESVMDEGDAGIWEFRGKSQKHAESYLFHWAGCHAAIKIANTCNDVKLRERAEKLQKLSQENIEKCYDDKVKAYGMSHENKKLNASEFLLVTMNYLSSTDQKALDHIKALEDELKTPDDLIYRYRDLDDFGETHSTFLICGFWYAEALASVGRVEDAKRVFENLLKTANHLGIFSEDVCPQDGSQWGNVAQTYSHVGLINTAFRISHKLDQPSFLTP